MPTFLFRNFCRGQTLCPVLSGAHQTSPVLLVLCAVSVSKKNAGLGSFSCCSVCSQLCTHTALGLLCFLRDAFPFRSTSAHGSQLDQPGLSSMLLVAVIPVFCCYFAPRCFVFCFFSLCFFLLFIQSVQLFGLEIVPDVWRSYCDLDGRLLLATFFVSVSRMQSVGF